MVSGNAENKTACENGTFLKVDKFIPEYEFGRYGNCNCIRGIWVYIGGTGHYFECDRYSVCDPNAAREAGRRQAFNLFKELYDTPPSERLKVFGTLTLPDLISKKTYDEIVEKLDAWKKEKEEIRVRDEVCQQAMQVRFVVTKIFTPSDGDAIVNGLKKDGTAVKGLLLCNVEKTGLHVDDLDSYLEV